MIRLTSAVAALMGTLARCNPRLVQLRLALLIPVPCNVPAPCTLLVRQDPRLRLETLDAKPATKTTPRPRRLQPRALSPQLLPGPDYSNEPAADGHWVRRVRRPELGHCSKRPGCLPRPGAAVRL